MTAETAIRLPIGNGQTYVCECEPQIDDAPIISKIQISDEFYALVSDEEITYYRAVRDENRNTRITHAMDLSAMEAGNKRLLDALVRHVWTSRKDTERASGVVKSLVAEREALRHTLDRQTNIRGVDEAIDRARQKQYRAWAANEVME